MDTKSPENAALAESPATGRITLPCPFCLKWNRIDMARAASRPKCGSCGTPILLDRPFVLHKDSFSRVISGSEVPVLVDFYADWCGPCKVMAPAVDELAREFLGRALVAKLNTDSAPAVSQMYQIRGIPTTIVFREGRELGRQVGAVPLKGLRDLLTPHL
jgi:thioredoxin 2